MADYTQIVKEEDVTNYKSRILLLLKMAEEYYEPSGKTKNKSITSQSHYTATYNVNDIKESGLFRLSKGCYNFDNTGSKSQGLDVEYLYVIKYNDNVFRQFYLVATDGTTVLTTRIYYKNRWYPWRTPSWLHPKYEILKNVRAYSNMHYISFGDFTIELPPAREFYSGDCVRLDQYEGIGKVSSSTYKCSNCEYTGTSFSICPKCGSHNVVNLSEEITTHSVKNVDKYQSHLNCTGFSQCKYFYYKSFYNWVSYDPSGTTPQTFYTLTTIFDDASDTFYWCIKDKDNNTLYKSVSTIFTAKHPCDATKWKDSTNTEVTITFSVDDRVNDKGMETYTSYIFEVLNDKESSTTKNKDYYRAWNYWVLTICTNSRSTREILYEYIETGFSELKQNIASIHTRTTNEVTTINDRIDSEVAELQNKIGYYHNVSWIQINTNNTVVSVADLHEVLDNSPSCKYLVSSTSNTIYFPDIDITYTEGQTIPSAAVELNKLVDKPIDVTVLSSGSCTFNNLPTTCKVAANQTATIQLIRYTTKYYSNVINHYEWVFTLRKQS